MTDDEQRDERLEDFHRRVARDGLTGEDLDALMVAVAAQAKDAFGPVGVGFVILLQAPEDEHGFTLQRMVSNSPPAEAVALVRHAAAVGGAALNDPPPFGEVV